jgi:hypothetical protein
VQAAIMARYRADRSCQIVAANMNRTIVIAAKADIAR